MTYRLPPLSAATAEHTVPCSRSAKTMRIRGSRRMVLAAWPTGRRHASRKKDYEMNKNARLGDGVCCEAAACRSNPEPRPPKGVVLSLDALCWVVHQRPTVAPQNIVGRVNDAISVEVARHSGQRAHHVQHD